ncbi:MAG: DUF934 domain-containing protein [Methyloglobulus sp.]|nr:DUF934 domain-containing protein [Methyloglobulus sp.]
MQIIKNNQLSNDAWEYKPDDADLGNGDVTVSLSRLQQEGKALSNRTGKLGVRIVPSDSVDGIVAFLPDLALVELYFPELADGRLFSHAWLLRNRYNYTGEIRATGHFLPDQVFYLSRVGVNSFYPENTADLASTLAGLKDFSVNYQPSVN